MLTAGAGFPVFEGVLALRRPGALLVLAAPRLGRDSRELLFVDPTSRDEAAVTRGERGR